MGSPHTPLLPASPTQPRRTGENSRCQSLVANSLAQVLRDPVQAIVIQAEVRQNGKHHTGDTGLGPAPAESDTSVVVKTAIQQERAGARSLLVPGREAQVPEQEHGVGGRRPPGCVEPAQVPTGSCSRSNRLPHPSPTILARSPVTVSGGASANHGKPASGSMDPRPATSPACGCRA